MKQLRMAWRNTWRNRRRTLATLSAMTLALVVSILYAALVNGHVRNLEHDALDFEVGAVQVMARGYQDHPSLHTAIATPDHLVQSLAARGLPACARLLAGALVAAGEASAGASVRGVDPEQDARVLDVSTQVLEGRWLDRADPQGVVLGRKLARTLAVKPGDELVLLSQAADGSMANALFKVRGVLRSLGEATDRAGVFMLAPVFRELFVFPVGAHQVMVRQPPGMSLGAVAAQVQAAAPELDVQTWRQLLPTMASLLDSMRGLVMMLLLVLDIVVAIVVLNAMLMAVFERIREFGVLKALGMSPGQVWRLILLETLIQVFLAVVLGTLLSLPPLAYLAHVGLDMERLAGVSVMGLAMSSRWYAVVDSATFTTPMAILVAMAFLAALYPAGKAARAEPVEAMRHV